MGELLLLLGASIYVLALLVYIFRVFSTQKFLALLMLFFPPLVFVNVVISRLKYAALVFYQLLGLILLGSGVAVEYPQKIAEYSGLNMGIFHSDDLNQNRVVRIKNSAGKSSAPVEKRDPSRDQASRQNVASSTDEKEKNTLEPELLIPESSASVTDGSLDEAYREDMLSPAEEMPDSEHALAPAQEPAPSEAISSVGPGDDEVSFWQDEEEDESMSMGDLLETPALHTSDDNGGGADLKQATQSPAKPPESLPVDTLSQAEDSVIALESRLNDEPAQNIIEEKEVPAHILEGGERVSDDNGGGADLKHVTQSPAKPQESLPVDTLSQAEDSVIALESRSIDEPAQNIIETKEKEVPAHILEERERVRKKQLEMDLLADSLQAKIGKMIIVEKYNAKKEEGKLLSVDNKKLALEKRIGAGTMESFIKLEDIKEVRSVP